MKRLCKTTEIDSRKSLRYLERCFLSIHKNLIFCSVVKMTAFVYIISKKSHRFLIMRSVRHSLYRQKTD